MSRRKDVCICGYETRSDYMRKHLQTCKARETIMYLRNENKILTTKIDVLNEFRYTDKDDEIKYLRNEIEDKNYIIKLKDEEIKRLSSNQTITNHFNVTNVLNIFPFGQEPIIDHTLASSLLAKPSESVPQYIKMKHFKNGLSNVRIRDDTIEVVEENEHGELAWVLKNKDETLFNITDTNLEEFHEEYGCTDFMWKRWFISNGYNQEGYENTQKFKDLMKKVESVFIHQSL